MTKKKTKKNECECSKKDEIHDFEQELSDLKEKHEKEFLISKEKYEKELSDLKYSYASLQDSFFRSKKENDLKLKIANEKIIFELLEVIDNLERSLIFSENSKDFDSLIQGVNMTLKQFKKILQKENVFEINEIDCPFNSEYHEVLGFEESKTTPDNQVLKVIRKGYKINDKLLRPMSVIVSKNNGGKYE